MSTKRLPVAGMTCDSCGTHVAAALEGAGAREVSVDWRRGVAAFADAAGVSEGALLDAVRTAGYEPGTVEDVEREARSPRAVEIGESRTGYDVAIVGSGSGAFAAAIRARDLGARVVMIEDATTGGTCVNVGCVPSKAMLRAAELRHGVLANPHSGVNVSADGVDLTRLVDAKQGLVNALRQEKYLDLIEDYGFDYRPGRGTFSPNGTLTVDGEPVQADKVIVATGASASAPPIPGLSELGYLTSTSGLDVTQLPESLIVLGANAIGLEMGQLFGFLGSKVTFLELMPRIAPFEEPEVSEAMRESLEKDGFGVVTGFSATRVLRDEGGHKVVEGQVAGERVTVGAAEILVATGRRPNTAGLGLEDLGVELDARGAVKIDARMATSNPDVFAVGDVTDSPQFVYVAAAQGAKAAQNALTGSAERIDLDTLPRVTFTHPQIASAGLTEAMARERGMDVRSSVLPLSAVPRALVNRDTGGLIKIVAEAGTDRIVGVSAIADAAGEVIAGAVYIVKMKMTVAEVADTWSPYLTMSEGVKLAAQTFGRDVSKLSCCAA